MFRLLPDNSFTENIFYFEPVRLAIFHFVLQSAFSITSLEKSFFYKPKKKSVQVQCIINNKKVVSDLL